MRSQAVEVFLPNTCYYYCQKGFHCKEQRTLVTEPTWDSALFCLLSKMSGSRLLLASIWFFRNIRPACHMIGSDFPSWSQDGCLIPSITATFKAGHSVEGAKNQGCLSLLSGPSSNSRSPSPLPGSVSLLRALSHWVPRKMSINFPICLWGSFTGKSSKPWLATELLLHGCVKGLELQSWPWQTRFSELEESQHLEGRGIK